MTDITQADLRRYSATVRRALRGWLAYHRVIATQQRLAHYPTIEVVQRTHEANDAVTSLRSQHDACGPEYWEELERILGGES
jgi:hypothetical protein